MGEAVFLSLIGYIKSLDTIHKFGKWAYGKLIDTTPVKNAIALTAKEYPDAAGTIESALKKLLTSDEFISELEKAESGKDIFADEILVNLLIDKGGFFTGIGNSTRDALKVIQIFSRNLRDELLRSDDATVHLGRQQDVHHKETLIAISALGESVRSGFAELRSGQMTGQFSGQEIASDAQLPFHEKLYQDRIQTAHDLLQEGKTDSVKSILSRLRKEVAEQNVSNELQVSIAGMLGRCALRANDPETALTEFTEALRLKNDCVMTQSYLAITALFLHKDDLANHYVDLIASSEKRDSVITANYIRALYGLGRQDDFEKFIAENKSVQEDSQCALILGMARYEQSRFDEAEKYFEIALRNPLLAPLAKLLDSQSIGNSVYKKYEDDPPFDWRIPIEIKERLEKAETQLLEVREIFRNYDDKTNYVEALVHLSHIQRMLLKFEEAVNSCSEALISDPSHAEALRHKAHLLLSQGNPEVALQLMQKIPVGAFDEHWLHVPMAKAYLRLKKFEDASRLLQPLLNLNTSDKYQLEIAGLLLICFSELKLKEEIDALKEQLLSLRTNDPKALVIVSQQLDREGRSEEALQLLESALEKCQNDRERDIVTIEAAEICFARELWDKAASLYERVVDTSKDIPIVRKYLFSLFHAGRAAPALDLSQKIRGSGAPLPFVSEIEARILEWIGDLQPALLIYESLSKQEPNQWGYKFSQIKILLRQGKVEKAAGVLLSIDYENIKEQPNALIKIAALRQKLELGDELKYAWQARRKGFAESKIHSKYIGIFLQRSKNSETTLDVLNGVQLDCVVKLFNPKTQ